MNWSAAYKAAQPDAITLTDFTGKYSLLSESDRRFAQLATENQRAA
jgi:hypothetical protein